MKVAVKQTVLEMGRKKSETYNLKEALTVKKLFTITVMMFLALTFVFSVVAVKEAKAESLLFPYYKNDAASGVYSFVSLTDVYGDATLHYIWNYDNLSTAAKECIHEDANGVSTAFDLLQHTVASPSLSGIDLDALFGDASTPAYSIAPYATEGFLIVESSPSAEADFYGQMIVVSASQGVLTAYKGLNNPTSLAAGDWDNAAVSKSSFMMSNYPASAVATSWFVLVTGTGMDNPLGWGGKVQLNNGFTNVWDRDEHPRSGSVPKDVTCSAVITRNDIMSAAQIAQSDNGGIWWETVTPDATTTATGALMMKIESTSALGSAMTAISAENSFPNFPY